MKAIFSNTVNVTYKKKKNKKKTKKKKKKKKKNISFAMVTNQIQQFGLNSDVVRGLLQKHFNKTFVKISSVSQK